MTSERSKRRDFLSLIFIAKSIPKKLLINKLTLLIYKGLTEKRQGDLGSALKYSCSIWYPYEIPKENRHDYVSQSDA